MNSHVMCRSTCMCTPSCVFNKNGATKSINAEMKSIKLHSNIMLT